MEGSGRREENILNVINPSTDHYVSTLITTNHSIALVLLLFIDLYPGEDLLPYSVET